MLWSPSVAIPAARIFNATITGDASVLVGSLPIASIDYNVSEINSLVGLVTDINDPAGTGGWTNLVELTGGPLIVAPLPPGNSQNGIAKISYDKDEDALNLRIQLLIDGIVAADLLIVPGGMASDFSASIDLLPIAVSGSTYVGSHPIYCETSFTLRAARVGTGLYSATALLVAPISYASFGRG